ncbi:MAG: hypothetical protein ACLQUY_28075 [Ktedonobacterales bacterium]
MPTNSNIETAEVERVSRCINPRGEIIGATVLSESQSEPQAAFAFVLGVSATRTAPAHTQRSLAELAEHISSQSIPLYVHSQSIND